MKFQEDVVDAIWYAISLGVGIGAALGGRLISPQVNPVFAGVVVAILTRVFIFLGLRGVVWVIPGTFGYEARSDGRQHAREDLQPQVLFVAQPVGAALEHADLVVQPLDETERHLVL